MLKRWIKNIDLVHVFNRLRVPRSTMSELETVNTFLALEDAICGCSEESCIEVLSLLPQSSGGLNLLAIGFLHTRWECRMATTRIFNRLFLNKV